MKPLFADSLYNIFPGLKNQYSDKTIFRNLWGMFNFTDNNDSAGQNGTTFLNTLQIKY